MMMLPKMAAAIARHLFPGKVFVESAGARRGELDPFADGTMQIGLVILAEHFNAEGWYWGGGYNREDGMHFEVGEETLKKWVDEGLLPSQ